MNKKDTILNISEMIKKYPTGWHIEGWEIETDGLISDINKEHDIHVIAICPDGFDIIEDYEKLRIMREKLTSLVKKNFPEDEHICPEEIADILGIKRE